MYLTALLCNFLKDAKLHLAFLIISRCCLPSMNFEGDRKGKNAVKIENNYIIYF